jgi:long-chain acyl-CoA synthetase
MGEHNLAGLADAALARHGDREALFFEGVWHRSGALAERSRRVAAGLIEAGVRPGDRVAVLMANCPEVGITYAAVWRAGAVVTPVIFLVSAAELGHILADSGATALVTTPELLATALEAARATPSLGFVAVAGDGGAASSSGGTRVLPFDELEAVEPVPNVAREDGDLAALMYTGGTTGRAKGVMLSHRSLYTSAQAAVQLTHVPGVTRALVPLPLSHSYGLIVSVAGMHAPEPGVAVLMRWFDPEEWLRLVAEHGVHLSTLVPSMIQMLLAQPLERHDLSSLHHITSGAAPLAADVREEFERRVPGVEILEGYGLTETSAIATTNPSGRRRAGSVGIPLPGLGIRIVDGDGHALPAGEDGEICVRAPWLMAGYWNAPDVTASTLVDGWLLTGDIGHLDADGYLTIVDRKKDLIIRGGFNVYPRDVEDVLLSHPAVAAAAVVGRPDARLGEEVVAFVELRPSAPATSEELLEHARARLAATKYPREVHVVDRIPLTSVLKVDRKALRATLVGAR